MQTTPTFDAVIIGGGPAGACAALRLLQLGRRVALIEKAVFPRPQIGESLSPGIHNIFRYLEADHLLQKHNYLHHLPAQVIWENTTPLNTDHGAGLMVDRALLDNDLLDVAVARGLHLFRPARFEYCCKKNEQWEIHIRLQSTAITVTSLFVLDARGRSGVNIQQRILTAPPTLATWSYTDAASMPAATLVEATAQGWCWGSPMPDGRFRIIAFTHPAKNNFRQLLSGTRLFSDVATTTEESCMVFTYAHTDPWNNGYIRLGEAAFTLDPLSSTGVEKAMRFSLQAVIALNTVFQSGNLQMAQTFYETRLAESVVQHLRWTSGYYAQAWPAAHAFWQSRATTFLENKPGDFSALLQRELAKTPPVTAQPAMVSKETVHQLWNARVQLSPAASWRDTPCVVDDALQIKKALHHPNLDREMAYLDQVEVSSLLSNARSDATLGSIINEWSNTLPFEQAVKMALFLWDKEIFIGVRG